ncbi:MAG: NAD(P)H-dependent flavin oxidoreductase [Dehalococcoidia bacterium]
MPGKLYTPICDLLGIEYPIFLAGMNSGGAGQAKSPTPVKLVAEISNAGGLGVLGDSFLSLEDLDQGIRELKSLVGGRPFGVDFMLPAKLENVGERTNLEIHDDIKKEYPEHVKFIQRMIEELELKNVEIPESSPMTYQHILKKIEIVMDNDVPIFAAALGDPALVSEKAHDQGMILMGMAGAPRHAERQIAAGTDIVVAQGTEAGGHTGSISTMVLVPQVVDVCSPKPVLAAGGIGTGSQVAAGLALGAQGAWIGTAFLVAEEGNSPEVQKDQILGARSEQFSISTSQSGKQQRAYHNIVREAWANSGLKTLPMPLQGVLNEPLNEAIKAAERDDLAQIPSGQIGGMLTERRPAREIFFDLVHEAEETIDSMKSNLK